MRLEMCGIDGSILVVPGHQQRSGLHAGQLGLWWRKFRWRERGIEGCAVPGVDNRCAPGSNRSGRSMRVDSALGCEAESGSFVYEICCEG